MTTRMHIRGVLDSVVTQNFKNIYLMKQENSITYSIIIILLFISFFSSICFLK